MRPFSVAVVAPLSAPKPTRCAPFRPQTSLNNTNVFVSSDNFGFAARDVERRAASAANMGASFVAAFATTNHGDVSPNTAGSFCIGTQSECVLTDLVPRAAQQVLRAVFSTVRSAPELASPPTACFPFRRPPPRRPAV